MEVPSPTQHSILALQWILAHVGVCENSVSDRPQQLAPYFYNPIPTPHTAKPRSCWNENSKQTGLESKMDTTLNRATSTRWTGKKIKPQYWAWEQDFVVSINTWHGWDCHTELRIEVVVFCWLLNVPATCECISGTDLHRQFYVLPHWDRSCRSNFPSHPVTVYWHRADQSRCWPYNARRLAG